SEGPSSRPLHPASTLANNTEREVLDNARTADSILRARRLAPRATSHLRRLLAASLHEIRVCAAWQTRSAPEEPFDKRHRAASSLAKSLCGLTSPCAPE